MRSTSYLLGLLLCVFGLALAGCGDAAPTAAPTEERGAATDTTGDPGATADADAALEPGGLDLPTGATLASPDAGTCPSKSSGSCKKDCSGCPSAKKAEAGTGGALADATAEKPSPCAGCPKKASGECRGKGKGSGGCKGDGACACSGKGGAACDTCPKKASGECRGKGKGSGGCKGDGACGCKGDGTCNGKSCKGEDCKGCTACKKAADEGPACLCEKGKAGEPVWCKACNVGYVDGKRAGCPGCVDKAKKALEAAKTEE